MGAIVAELERLAVRKTYKLYIGGKFPRTESGRSYLVSDSRGRPLANACRGSRKDVRDAVRAARGAFAGWSGLTAYNRGQILYRVAEMLEGRRKQFVDEVAAAEGSSRRGAGDAVDKAIDRWVWYAGWSRRPTPRCSAWSRGWRRRSCPATPPWCWPPRTARCRR